MPAPVSDSDALIQILVSLSWTLMEGVISSFGRRVCSACALITRPAVLFVRVFVYSHSCVRVCECSPVACCYKHMHVCRGGCLWRGCFILSHTHTHTDTPVSAPVKQAV